MARWTPDPTFYPSPRLAGSAPPETLGYVALVEPDAGGPARRARRDRSRAGLVRLRLDRLDARDAEPRRRAAPLRLERVQRGALPVVAAAARRAPLPARARPALLAHVRHRHQARPARAAACPDDRGRRDRRAAPATRGRTRSTAAPTRSTSPRSGATTAGDEGGGIFLLDCDSFDLLGAWEVDRGPQRYSYDFWWHLGYDTLLSSEWGTPTMFENGVVPEKLLGREYGHHVHVWDLRKRRHLQALDLGDEHQMVLELRPAHDPRKTYGFVGVVVSVEDLSASVWLWHRDGADWAIKKVIDDPGRAGRGRPAAAAAQGLRRRAAAGHRHQPLARRPAPLRLVLGHRRLHPVRRVRPLQPEGDGARPARRHRLARAAPGVGEPADRRPADGRGIARRPSRLRVERALHDAGTRSSTRTGWTA